MRIVKKWIPYFAKEDSIEGSKDVHESEKLFAELDCLEWLRNSKHKHLRLHRCSICGKKLSSLKQPKTRCHAGNA
jgi:hypothetical protein